jgi:N-acetyl-gamma-glutamyl-phosphate reductase
MKNKKSINIAIVGASGYTGLELIKIMLNHPSFNIAYLANTTGGMTINELHPCLNNVCELEVYKANANDIAASCDLAFLALPHKHSMGFAKELLKLGVKVVDLSADYRLELDVYEKHYCPHTDKDNLQNAVYGMPEFYKEEIKKASLVANPGCYPTASLLALMPFVPYIDENSSVFIDAKSGLSGAGKKLSDTSTFVNISENMFAYNPLKHRHTPEIIEKVKLVGKKDLKINFVPHLIPLTRGMLTSVYCSVNQNIDAVKVLKEFYKDQAHIRVLDKPVTIKDTSGTNFCDIFVVQNGNDLFINSSIDNLLRGASSQAVVNANIMYGFDDDLGINKLAFVP